MTSYACKTRDGSGALVERTVEAGSQREVMDLLRAGGLVPIQVRKLRAGASATNPSGAGSGRRRRVKTRDVLHVTTRLAAALRAGVPILSSIALMRDQARNPALQEVLASVHAEIEGGQPLSAALAEHPTVFSEVYIHSVAAGELSGTLEQLLDNLAEFLEADMTVRSDVRSALLYPAILITTLGMAVSVLMVFVVPRFAVMYSGMGSDLPLPTRIMVGSSNLVTNNLLALVSLGFALAYGAVRYVRTPSGRHKVDALLLRVPVIGKLIDTAITLRAVQMLGLFCEVGLPILDGLAIIARTTRNSQVRGQLEEMAEAVACGETLSGAMQDAGCFDPAVRQMIATGESTGSLEASCRTVTVQLKKDLAYLTRNLSMFIEPIMTLVLAVIVLFVALATFLPMWDMIKVVNK